MSSIIFVTVDFTLRLLENEKSKKCLILSQCVWSIGQFRGPERENTNGALKPIGKLTYIDGHRKCSPRPPSIYDSRGFHDTVLRITLYKQ